MSNPRVKRSDKLEELDYSFKVAPVCGLIGPRQCGKTTLALEFAQRFKGKIHHFDLEDGRDLARLQDPILTLSSLEGLIIIDEIHHAPDLFKSLRVLVDEHKKRQFLILGSASQKLLQQSSESLAGRIRYFEMMPFSLEEVGTVNSLWLRGGFPRSFLAENEKISTDWRRAYIKTFLEKDIPGFGFTISSPQIRRFWEMLAHYHGQNFNASEIGASLGINYKTAQSYLDLLDATFMVRRLNPWFENIKKRQVKSPKVYFRDSGLYHTLLGIGDEDELTRHPKLGSSWEGFAMEQVIRHHKAESEDCYFWATQSQAELDLMIVKEGKRLGFEFKYASSPSLTKSMQTAFTDVKLHHLSIITPNAKAFPLAEDIYVYSLEEYLAN